MLDIVKHRINLEWLTSQDRERYMQEWDEQKSLASSGSATTIFDDDPAKTKSIFDRFDSWSDLESFLAKSA